ncbi:acyl-CoA thioesterase [Pseudomonas sp. ICMP 460]|nr:acyl-CoA thioesterase [Pseudomonas sp. ICMP 460]
MVVSLSQLFKTFDASHPFTVPANWLQGRTIYGGLTAALSLEAVRQSIPLDLPPLKSAHVTFISPSTQEQVFFSKVLRQGKSVTTVAVECLSAGELTLQMTMVFTAHRESPLQHNFFQPPNLEAPQHLASEFERRKAPPCVYNFDMRPATGSAAPFSGANHPELQVWVKHLDAEGVDPVVALIALADALPPAAVTVLTEPVPLSTVSWTFDIVSAPEAGGWFLLKSSSQQAAGGYSLQDMEVWSEAGTLVLRGRQTVAVFA